MADRSIRGRWMAVVTASCILCALASLAAACSATGVPVFRARTRAPVLRVLQMNLCNGGTAGCYTGRSLAQAVALIRAQRPAVVTVNEICRNDLPILRRAMSQTAPNKITLAVFRAAPDRVTGGPFRCTNGQPYGIGVIAETGRLRAGTHTYGGRYPMQDLSDPEERVWACIDAVREFYACTTHTANTSTAIALAQCRYLLNVAVPGMVERGGVEPLALGADLNLRAGHSPGPQSCVPPTYSRADDGALQDVVASAGYTVRFHVNLDMHGTTDHPGLLVGLVRRG